MDPLLVQLTTTLAPSTNTTDITTNHNNTTTFLIGFGILLVFVVFGVLASAFLCLTLKKDAYLWEAEQQQMQQGDSQQRHQSPVSIVIQSEEESVQCQGLVGGDFGSGVKISDDVKEGKNDEVEEGLTRGDSQEQRVDDVV